MSKTPTLDQHRELSAAHPMLGNMFAKSAANRVLMDREQQALDDAAAAKVDKAEAKALAAQPHHKKLAELRAQHPMLADVYAQNHRYWLELEVKEAEAKHPKPAAAPQTLGVSAFLAPPNPNPPPDDPPPQAA